MTKLLFFIWNLNMLKGSFDKWVDAQVDVFQ